MHRLAVLLALLAAALAALLPAAATALEVPYLTGRVNDRADLLSPEQEQVLEEKLRAFEEQTGAQVAVLTVPGLEGEVLEDFSLRVAETWGLGREGFDDGVLLLIARDDRQLRIEVGYGLEPELTDLEARAILDGVIVPRFRQGRFGEGIGDGVDAILAALGGAEVPPPEETSPAGSPGTWPSLLLAVVIFVAVVGTFSFNALFSGGCQSWFLWVFLMPFYFGFGSAFAGLTVGVVLLALWVVGFPLAKLWLGRTPAGRSFLDRHPRWTAWATSGGGFGSGGGSSGGGFSGGGGSFGGGGASSSW